MLYKKLEIKECVDRTWRITVFLIKMDRVPLTRKAPDMLMLVGPCVGSDAMLSCSFIKQSTSLPVEISSAQVLSQRRVSSPFGGRFIRIGGLELFPLLDLLKVLLCRLEGIGLLDRTSSGL